MSLTDTVQARPAAPANMADRISAVGPHLLRYSIVIVLGWIGAMKFTAYEAEAIQGLIASSPLLYWLYDILSLRGAANLIGTIEVTTALLIAFGPLYRPAAILGALGAIATFLVTMSFILTAPPVFEASLGGFPALSVVPGQFLLKDIVLLAAAVVLLGQALRRRPEGAA